MTTERTYPKEDLGGGYDVIKPAVYYELPPAQPSTISVVDEVVMERRRQDAKWGPQQDNPWNAGYAKPFEYLIRGTAWDSVEEIKRMVDDQAKQGTLGMCEILLEEVCEAFDEHDLARVREELVQVAAVAVKAVESIDRNGR